ncbi:MAG: hypothetical protein EBZ36_17955 [Acidobacteria bacterium]|nr:hypothetical protein [Acidobacteriota bacterium]
MYFSDTTYSNVEIRASFTVSAPANITLSGHLTLGSFVAVADANETITAFNNTTPFTPTTTYSNTGTVALGEAAYTLSGIFVMNMSNNQSSAVPRNYYQFDSTYCKDGLGSVRIRGLGMIAETAVTNPLDYIILTASTGTISVQWSTVHYY